MNKLLSMIGVCFAVLVVPGAANEVEPPEDPTTASEADVPAEPTDDAVESAVEEWRRTLKYGIDSEVLELLPQLREQRRDELAQEVLDVMGVTLNTEVRVEALRYLTELEIREAMPVVEGILVAGAESSDFELLQEALRYVNGVVDEAAEPLLEAIRRLAEDRNPRIAASAVRTLGEIGDASDVRFLLELYDRRGTREEVRHAILLSLGDLGSQEAESLLLAVAEDAAADDTSRYYAIDSLSKVGSTEARALFEDILGQDDAIMRSYAVAALARYDGPEISETLIRALRDSFWRVRVSALKGLADRETVEALPAVKYKLERDPEMRVRYEAVKTVGAIGTEEAWEYLRSLYVDQRVPVTVRNSIAEQLIGGDLADSLEALVTVMDQEWERQGSVLLDYAAKELSRTNSAHLGDIYAKLLSHPNFIIQIYAIRGIGLNELGDFREDLAALADHESAHRAVRSNAKASLDAIE